MKITLSGFRGANRALHPLLLPDAVGVDSRNQNPVRGDLRPLKSPLTVASVPAGRQTIYRMGRDVARDDLYWLSWTGVVDVVRGGRAGDTTERTYFTGDGVPKWTDNTLLGGAPYPTAWRALGVPAPLAAPVLAATGGVSLLSETRSYVYTYVNDKAEESAPSPVSLLLTCKPDAGATLTGLSGAPTGYGITLIRVYRTQADAGGVAEYFFLREIAANLTTTTDDLRPLASDVLPSVTWTMPPIDLTGLTGLWNGMMAGISGNAVRFCEAYQPYAWPLAYEVLPPDAKPVALAKFGQSLLVLTTGRPMLVTGGTPDAMDSQPLELAEACISARSVVSFGHGVAWSCPDGLAYFGSGGAKMITAGLMTRDDWQAIKPETIVGGVYEGAYLGFFTVSGVTKGFLIDPLNPTGLYFTDIPGSAVFFDELQDALYVLDGASVKKWDAGAALTALFKSKLFRSPKPASFACAEIVADSYPVTCTFYADGVLMHTQTAANNKPFRLPPVVALTWQFELTCTGAVQGLAMASTMTELADT